MANLALSAIGALVVLLTVTVDCSETQGLSLSRFDRVYGDSYNLFRGTC